MKAFLFVTTLLIAAVSTDIASAQTGQSDGWSQATPTGNKFRVNLTQSTDRLNASVTAVMPEAFMIEIGSIVGGKKRTWCNSVTSTESTTQKELLCPLPSISNLPISPGAPNTSLYVDIKSINSNLNSLAFISCFETSTKSTCVSAKENCSQFTEGTTDYQRCIEDAASRVNCTYNSEKPSGCYGSYTLTPQQ